MKFTLLCIFFLLSTIYAQDCTNVTYTEGPLNCTAIDGYLFINHSISDNVDGLLNVTSVSGELFIHKSNNLTNLNGLSNLKSAGIVWITDNDVLASVVLSSLETSDRIRIANNFILSSVNFPKLKEVKGDFVITSVFNPSNETSSYVKQLKLESLTNIVGDLEITNKAYLKDTQLLMEINVNSLSTINGSLSINTIGPKDFNNWKLSSVRGFNVENVGGLISISMDSLASVNGSFTLRYNNDLKEMKLPNLNFIGGYVTNTANSTFCIVPTMFGANLPNCTSYTTCKDSHFDTCRACNKSYYGLTCSSKCNCTDTQICASGLTGDGSCSNNAPCKDNEMKLGERCIETLYVGLIIGGIVLVVVIIIVVIIVVAKKNSGKSYQKLH